MEMKKYLQKYAEEGKNSGQVRQNLLMCFTSYPFFRVINFDEILLFIFMVIFGRDILHRKSSVILECRRWPGWRAQSIKQNRVMKCLSTYNVCLDIFCLHFGFFPGSCKARLKCMIFCFTSDNLKQYQMA